MEKNSIKLVFFDMDGTLSVPIYKDAEGNDVLGFSQEEWERYCVLNGEDTYQYCKPVEPVRQYAKRRKAEGAKLFVLTTSSMSFENDAKRKFANRYYPDLFEDIIAVGKDAMKAVVMRHMAEKFQTSLCNCELVEDTYATLLDVVSQGMKGTHITHIISSDEIE